MSLRVKSNYYKITECRYIDRNGYATPKKFISKKVPCFMLGHVLSEELDTESDKVEFVDGTVTTVAAMISEEAENAKPRILILLRNGNCLQTKFKNRFRRTIYLELSLNAEKADIKACYYADKRDGGKHRVPNSLINLGCGADRKSILTFVNDELAGGFTNILIANEHDIDLDHPICGAI